MQKHLINAVVLFIALFLSHNSFATESERISRTEYIDSWKEVAMQNMIQFQIPASITLAQGILESGDGNSELAKMSNNHFGIKCHGWKGEKVYYDDDAKGECFRKYIDAGASFTDHSHFLLKKRYEPLFKLKVTDYKGWAKGLKKCGYATNPAYAKLLIDIIEKNKLYLYDKQAFSQKDELLANSEETEKKQGGETLEPISGNNPPEIPSTITLVNSRNIMVSDNQIKYILAKEEDTIKKIAKDIDLPVFLLAKYNDEDTSNRKLKEGELIYIQPKRRRYRSREYHTVRKGETMRQISQYYGVKLKVLYRKNNLERGSEPAEGSKLSLKNKVTT